MLDNDRVSQVLIYKHTFSSMMLLTRAQRPENDICAHICRYDGGYTLSINDPDGVTKMSDLQKQI